jgi:hypothetical protein
VSGYAVIVGGDDRYVGNVFLGGDVDAAYGQGGDGVAPAYHGLIGYDGYPGSFAEYLHRVDTPGDHQRFLGITQAVYARDNVYAAGAHPFAGETDLSLLDGGSVTIVEEGDAVWLETDLPSGFDQVKLGVVGGRDLERVRFADADFEERDGSPAVIDVDLLGERKAAGGRFAAGPVAGLAAGSGRVRVW